MLSTIVSTIYYLLSLTAMLSIVRESRNPAFYLSGLSLNDKYYVFANLSHISWEYLWENNLSANCRCEYFGIRGKQNGGAVLKNYRKNMTHKKINYLLSIYRINLNTYIRYFCMLNKVTEFKKISLQDYWYIKPQMI